MKILQNLADQRVVDRLRALNHVESLDIASDKISLAAIGSLLDGLKAIDKARLILNVEDGDFNSVLGSDSEREFRNQLRTKSLAQKALEWISKHGEARVSESKIPQAIIAAKSKDAGVAFSGSCTLDGKGLGLVPSDRLGLIQSTESDSEMAAISEWFNRAWDGLADSPESSKRLTSMLQFLSSELEPSLVYYLILYRLFRDKGEELDEESIIKSATGIHESVVWKKLYKFQRDGVVGAIDKLERYNGAILADSVGLGKTFEALAVIKYYQLRNDRVLVLCPKRLRENWTLYASNDRRNPLASDRLNYDVLNHTDLSRETGLSGDIDLAYLNWGNYDLVVIDESHNFRNKSAHRDHLSRYDRLMMQIIQSGVKTRVLMLSATPVNNRLADLKNQIAFITEGNDAALSPSGIPSIDATLRLAQKQFNRWLKLDETERTQNSLLDRLGFDYFKLLDLLTIARSRKHVVRYYGTADTGRFPERLIPINRKCEVDLAGKFPSVASINNEIRRLHLAAYAPLRYVLPQKQKEYDDHYSQKLKGSGQRIFRQADREESLVALMRVNLLKRMESSVVSFDLTVKRQLNDVNRLIEKIDNHEESIEELSIEDIDPDDSVFESLLVGRKVKVLLQDMDKIRWRQDLVEDRNRLATLASSSEAVTPDRDAKLAELKRLIADKARQPINPGNRKALLFTAFADTADYLYREIAPWIKQELGIETAIVTGSSRNQSTLRSVGSDLGAILSAFSPRSKERSAEFQDEGEIDLLIATDCISEGQNLQDCDFLINYDIHWNPVRIIQRFGRIDRLGSINERIQLVNFWPNVELEEYINLEQRVSGRMVLLDVSATGEENIIEHQSGDQMNDLEYRRTQLLRLQDAVIDLEDLSSGISIADLTLNDFRVDLARVVRDKGDLLERLPFTTMAATCSSSGSDAPIPSGVIFCLKAMGEAAERPIDPSYPLAPNYLVHVSDEGETLLSFSHAKQILDRLRQLCLGKDLPDAMAYRTLDRRTRSSEEMSHYQSLLARAIASVLGKQEERAVASLFETGGTHAFSSEIAGASDFEVVAWLAILPSGPEK